MEFFNWVVPTNEGLLDRVIRVFAGIGFFAGAAFSGPILGPMGFAGVSVFLGVIGFILVVSGLIGYCPLYNFIGAWTDKTITTCPRKLSRVEILEQNKYSSRRYKEAAKDYLRRQNPTPRYETRAARDRWSEMSSKRRQRAETSSSGETETETTTESSSAGS
jgi:hypothetical protein